MTQYLVDAVALGAVYALFTLGLSLCWGVLNLLNLAHGAIFMAGALTAYELSAYAGLNLWETLPIGMLASAVLAGLADLLVFRTLRRRARSAHEAELAILISSIALASAIVAVGQVRTGGLAVGYQNSFFTQSEYHVAGVAFSNIQIAIVVCAIVLTVAVAEFVRRTQTGRAIRAVAQDRQTAGLMGISADAVSLGVIAVGGALAGLAGVLYSTLIGVVDSSMGDDFLFKAFVVIVLAGVGSIGWAFVGAMVLALIETFMTAYASANLEGLVVFGIVMLFLAFRPQGITGKQMQRV